MGDVYSDFLAQELGDFNIQLRPQQYDSEHAKGVIMSQEPEGGTEVKKGADIWITISMGAEPEEKTMDDYIGFRQEEVKSALTGQGFQPLFSDEPSDEYPVGVIIRTDPAAGTPLQEGQSIKIYVSSGPDMVTAQMLDVVGKDKTHAVELLEAKGFDQVRTVTVDSEEPADTVVYQSETAGEEIDITTEIILEISSGPAETTEATEEVKEQSAATMPAPTEPKVKINVSFALPDRDEAYTVTVLRDGVAIATATVDPSSDIFNLPDVEGTGVSVFELLVDGVVYSSQTREFK